MDDNEAFSIDEQQRVAIAVGEVETYLLTVLEPNLDADQKEVVRREATFHEGAATRLGKKDWLNGYEGFVMNLMIAASLKGDEITALFRFASQQISRTAVFVAATVLE